MQAAKSQGGTQAESQVVTPWWQRGPGAVARLLSSLVRYENDDGVVDARVQIPACYGPHLGRSGYGIPRRFSLVLAAAWCSRNGL